jgi:hypothetical protein
VQYYAIEIREAAGEASKSAERVMVGASLGAARERARELAAKHRDKIVRLVDRDNRLVSY